MVDIVQMKKGAEKVYPETHYNAVQGRPDESLKTVQTHNGLEVNFHRSGVYCEMFIYKNATSVFPRGEISLGVIVPEIYRPVNAQVMRVVALEGSDPTFNIDYVIYINSEGYMYIYTEGIIDTKATLYGNHMYILK